MLVAVARDLQYRMGRFLGVLIAAAVCVGLGAVATNWSSALDREAGQLLDGQGAQFWIAPSGAAGPFTAAPAISAAMLADVRKLPDVLRADPVLVARSTIEIAGTTTDVTVLGVEPGGLGGITDVDLGAAEVAPGEMILTRGIGGRLHTKAQLVGSQLSVVGIAPVRSAFGQPVVVADIDDVRRVFADSQKVATMIVIRGEVPDPPAGLAVFDERETRVDLIRSTAAIGDAGNVFGRLLLATAAILVGLAGVAVVLDQRRDVALRRQYGVTRWRLIIGQTVQAALLATAAVIGGLVVAAIADRFGGAVLDRRLAGSDFLRTLALVLPLTVVGVIAGVGATQRTRPLVPFASLEGAR